MKCKLSYVCPIFVLFAGLASCARNEKSTKDVFIAPPPKIVRSGAALDLKAWDQEAVKSVRLTDALDFRGSGAASAYVTARCRHHAQAYIATNSAPVDQLAHFFSIVPEEVLTEPLTVEPAFCSFEIILANDYGSRHIFNVAEMPLEPEDETALQGTLYRQGQKLPPSHELTFSELANVRIEAKDAHARTARLICQDVFSKKIDLKASTSLADLASETLRQNQRPRAPGIEQRPRQFCRVAFLQGERPVEITPLYRLRFPEPAIQVTTISAPYRNFVRDVQMAYSLINGRSFRMPTNEFELRNSGVRARILRIPKRRLFVHIGMPSYYPGAANQPGLAFPWLGLQPAAGPNAVLEDKEDHWRLTLGPQSSARISVFFEVMEFFFCSHQKPTDHTTDLIFDFPEPLIFHEISETGEDLGSTEIALGPRLLIVKNATEAYLRNYRFREVGVCEGAKSP